MKWFRTAYTTEQVEEILKKIHEDEQLSSSEEETIFNFLRYEINRHPSINKQNLDKFHLTREELVHDIAIEIYTKYLKNFNPDKASVGTWLAMYIKSYIVYLDRHYKRQREIPRKDMMSIFQDMESEFENDGPVLIEKLKDSLPDVEDKIHFEKLWDSIENKIKQQPSEVQKVFKAKTIEEFAEEQKGKVLTDTDLAYKLKMSPNVFRRILNQVIIPLIEKEIENFEQDSKEAPEYALDVSV